MIGDQTDPFSMGQIVIDLPSRVLVVVPTLNEEKNISSVLHQLRDGLPNCLSVCFVICDGGSTDGTVEIVQQHIVQDSRVVLLENPKRIQSAAVNLAARQYGSDFDILIRCDAHSVYPKGFIYDLVRSMRHIEADSIVVPMDSIGDTCVRSAIAWVSDTPLGSGGSAHRGGHQSGYVDHGHHAAFRMSTFLRCGGYDETFTHNEDAEFDCRQRALGFSIFLDGDIRIGYYPRGNLFSLARQYFNYGRGRSRTVRKHPKSLRLRQLAVPMHFILFWGSLALSFWLTMFLLWPIFYISILIVVSLYIAASKKQKCGLLAGPFAAVMHFSWAWGFLIGMITLSESRWKNSDVASIAVK